MKYRKIARFHQQSPRQHFPERVPAPEQRAWQPIPQVEQK